MSFIFYFGVLWVRVKLMAIDGSIRMALEFELFLITSTVTTGLLTNYSDPNCHAFKYIPIFCVVQKCSAVQGSSVVSPGVVAAAEV